MLTCDGSSLAATGEGGLVQAVQACRLDVRSTGTTFGGLTRWLCGGTAR
jgi:hypothetical protein